jgi:hypothetical protein
MKLDEIDISNYEIENIPLENETPRSLLMQMYKGQDFEELKHPSGRDFTWEEMRETYGAMDLIMDMVQRSTWVGIRLRKK